MPALHCLVMLTRQSIPMHQRRIRFKKKISHEDSTERIVLTKSYRSTKQISDFTSYFSPSNEPVEPFNRSGVLPEVIRLTKSISEKDALLYKIEEKQQEGYETIAIIAKTAAGCDDIYRKLHKEVDIKQINEDSKTYQKGIVVVPVYLAKGIEFDAVILADASDEVYSYAADRYLLYTACTRAMHDLTILFSNEMSPFLSKILTRNIDIRQLLRDEKRISVPGQIGDRNPFLLIIICFKKINQLNIWVLVFKPV